MGIVKLHRFFTKLIRPKHLGKTAQLIFNINDTKTITSVGLTYISTHADSTSHAARYIANVCKFHERRISSVEFTSVHLYGNVYMRVGVARALADSYDFGLLVEQSSQKCVISCLGSR